VVNGVDVPNVVGSTDKNKGFSPPEVNPSGAEPPEKSGGVRHKSSSVGWSDPAEDAGGSPAEDKAASSDLPRKPSSGLAGDVPFGGRLPPAESKSLHDEEPDDEAAYDKEPAASEAKEGSRTGSPNAYDDYEPNLPRGVTRDATDGSYTAGIVITGKYRNLGTFDTVEEAAAAYKQGKDKYARK